MVGIEDDSGLLPGEIKLDGAGGRRFTETFVGVEKSLI